MTPSSAVIDETVIRLTDADLIKEMVAKIGALPDRDQMVNDLKSRVEAGTYNPTGDDIADTMIRRAIADRVR